MTEEPSDSTQDQNAKEPVNAAEVRKRSVARRSRESGKAGAKATGTNDKEKVSPDARAGTGKSAQNAAPTIGRAEAAALMPHLDAEAEKVAGYNFAAVLAPRSALEARMQEREMPLLDAWHASFVDPLRIMAQSESFPDAGTRMTTREIVLGEDDRVEIDDTEDLPWRWICALRITAADGSTWTGTGWLVGPRVVATAGHCVFIHDHGGWVDSIEIRPGVDGDEEPYQSCVSGEFKSVSGWTSSQSTAFDVGAIVLPADAKLGEELGYFGIAQLSDAYLAGRVLNLSGYPADKPARTQWFQARKAESVLPTSIVYNIDTAGGQSGSPVWTKEQGGRYVVGIHTNGAEDGNSATRLYAAVYQTLAGWSVTT